MADPAEEEASEVLHSLLSVERIEKQDVGLKDGRQTGSTNFQSVTNSDAADNQSTVQWHTPVSIAHSLFSAIDANAYFSQSIDDQKVVIWEGHAIVDASDTSINTIYTEAVDPGEETSIIEKSSSLPQTLTSKKQLSSSKKVVKNAGIKKKVVPKKKKLSERSPSEDPTILEESAVQVKERFKRGCDCQEESCFRGLNPESVYKHRLNIAELTKGEHDMYLMGVTMACLANPDTTVRHKERRRLRTQYVYQGRRVCLDAFLYLENCTHYQLKRIRKHVMTHGVAPRIHGNHGKKPHNTFPLDIYCHATEFLKQYLEQQTGEKVTMNTKSPIQLPWDVTRKNLHDAYKVYGQILEPGIKLMGYSTFRHFMKEQFPHVKFCKTEPKNNTHNSSTQSVQQVTQNNQQSISATQQPQITQQLSNVDRSQDTTVQKCVINNEVQQVIPLVVAPQNDNSGSQHHQQTFLVTAVPQLLPNTNTVAQQNTNNQTNANTFSYQLTNTGYLVNEQGNIITTMTGNGQHHAPYTFNRM